MDNPIQSVDEYYLEKVREMKQRWHELIGFLDALEYYSENGVHTDDESGSDSEAEVNTSADMTEPADDNNSNPSDSDSENETDEPRTPTEMRVNQELNKMQKRIHKNRRKQNVVFL